MKEIKVNLEDVSKYGMCKAVVLGYIRSSHTSKITIQDIASDMGRSPMGIHRHIRNLENLGVIAVRRGQLMRGNPVVGIYIRKETESM